MSRSLVGEWSRLLATSLAQAGLADAVICPGSRSTPFAWALAETPGIRCHSLIDERAAGFFALGLARVTGRAALVLCTSGSAAANFFPAIVEASLARVPLVVLTADRPLEVQAAEAAQTIDQVKLYGDHVRRCFDLGTPDPSPSVLGGLQRLTVQALTAAHEPEPGPVHLNARARKPLEPGPATTEAEREVASTVSALIARGVTRVAIPERTVSPSAVRELAQALSKSKRPLLVCGPLPIHADAARAALSTLAERAILPLFAEATSGLRWASGRMGSAESRGAGEPESFLGSIRNQNPSPPPRLSAIPPTVHSAPVSADALDLLLRSPACRAALAPDCVVRFGGTPTSGAFDALLTEHPSAALHVVAEHGHPDPSGRARTLTLGPLGAVASELTAQLAGHVPSQGQQAFARSVAAACARAWDLVGRVLEAEPAGSEPAAVRAAIEAVPTGGLVVVGNSLPVRLLDAFVPAGERGLHVASQRGANGIDGLVAGAAGSALAFGRPTLLVLGDVSVAHDLGGLAAARLVKSPFVVLVIDNGGGRIFDHLPVARLYGEQSERAELWLTPPQLALEHAGPLFGIPYGAPRGLDELRAALHRAWDHPGATLLHVRVAQESARSTLQRLKLELDREGRALLAGAP